MAKKSDKFICIERCFHNNRMWDPAQTDENDRPVVYTRERIGGVVPRHFRRVDEKGAIMETETDAEKREFEEWNAAKEKKTAERKAFDAAQEPSAEAEDLI